MDKDVGLLGVETVEEHEDGSATPTTGYCVSIQHAMSPRARSYCMIMAVNIGQRGNSPLKRASEKHLHNIIQCAAGQIEKGGGA